MVLLHFKEEIMYCKHCGKEIQDGSDVCLYCGASVETKEEFNALKENDRSKTGVGFSLGFFLILIGLIIGFAIYPPDTEARKTFKKGWLIGFLSAFTLGFIIGLSRACLLLS